MAELKYGHDDLEKAIAEFDCGEDESDQGILSPVDCWELVGSSPRSPFPETSVDVSALEEAVTAACVTGGSLQDDYFGCTHISAHNEVLPVSTLMAERQIEDEGHSESVDEGQASARSDALVSVDSDTDAVEDCASASSIWPIRDIDDVHLNDCVSHDDHMRIDALMYLGDGMHHHDPMCHDDDYMQHDDDICRDYDNILVHNDGHVHHGDTGQRKMDDECHNEIMGHDEGWHVEDNILCTDEDDAHLLVAESMAVANAHHDVCTLTPSSPLDGLASPSYARAASHDTEDGYMNIQNFGQVDCPTVTLNDSGRDVTGQFNEPRDFVDVQHGMVNTRNRQYHKGLACASWIWTQLSRWQAQLGCANTIWSVTLAAAVMGLLVLGRGWQRLQAQNRTLRTQLWAKEKRITQLMFQLMQTKDCLSKIRRVPVICVKPSPQIPQGHA